MDRFIRITGCHTCPWNRTKLLPVKDGVLRSECGVSPAENGGFKDCPPLKITSEQQPIPEWCPLESEKHLTPKEAEGLIVKGQTVAVSSDSVLSAVLLNHESKRLAKQANEIWSALSSEPSENFQKCVDAAAKAIIINSVNSLRTMGESELIPRYLSIYGLTEDYLKSGDQDESS